MDYHVAQLRIPLYLLKLAISIQSVIRCCVRAAGVGCVSAAPRVGGGGYRIPPLPLRRVMITRPAGVLPIAPLARRDRPEAHILQNCSLCKNEPMSKITQRLTPSQTQDGLTLMKQRLFNALDKVEIISKARIYVKSPQNRKYFLCSFVLCFKF